MPTLVLVTHSIGQTFSLQSLLLQGLLQGQDLSLVLFDCQFHRLARLRAALVCTQSVRNKISWQHWLKQRPECVPYCIWVSVCMSPVLLLIVQQSLQVSCASLSLTFFIFQGTSPSLPLPFLLQQLIVQGLQLNHLLLQHAACGLQRLNVLEG